MVHLEILFYVLLIIMIPLIIIGSISFLFNEKILGFVLLLIAVCIFFILYPMEKEVIKEQEEYKKNNRY
jgi:amino acid permease